MAFMKYHVIYLFCFFSVVWHLNVHSQSRGERYVIDGEVFNSSLILDPANFIPELLQNAILDEINKMRMKNFIEPLEVIELLQKPADDQANFMAQHQSATILRDEKEKNSTADRLMFYGGSRHGEELVERTSTNSRSEYFPYFKIAYDIAFKWFLSSKTERILLSPEYIFAGIASSLDQSGNAVYVSLLLGNYDSFNEGVALKSKLEIPVTEKIFGIKPYDERECKKLEKFENLEELQKGITVQNQNIVFRYDDLRYLKRIFRNNKDGIMIDLVQKEQYSCDHLNIVDNNLPNKGVVLQKVYAKKLFKNNTIEEKQSNSFESIIGELPENIKGDFELNLIVLQNKHICANFHRTFTFSGEGDFDVEVQFLADTITINSEFEYKPTTDTTLLSFRIPFEKRKFTYKETDIKALIDSLNEPDFKVHELVISAYSSVEGTKEENKILQQRRAESIINAIKKLQNEDIISRVETGDNWELFKRDVMQTEFKSLASMSMEEAQSYLNKMNPDEKLETILSNHRYAQVDMKVTYYIKGKYEQQFVLNEFNKAIINRDLPLALSIQKYIFKKIINALYNTDAVFDQNIPFEPDFAGLLMNKLWLENYVSSNGLKDFESRILDLYKLNSSNDYIKFNYAYVLVKNAASFDQRKIRDIQSLIDELYFSTFTKKTVDGLNLFFQLKILDLAGEDGFEKVIEESLNRIREMIDIKALNTQKALHLAYLFMKYSDYNYAFKVMNSFVLNANVNEDFIFTYLSLCSRNKSSMYSNRFLFALERANNLNHEQFCELFKGNYFSFQVFDNLKAKEFYCKECVLKGNY